MAKINHDFSCISTQSCWIFKDLYIKGFWSFVCEVKRTQVFRFKIKIMASSNNSLA